MPNRVNTLLLQEYGEAYRDGGSLVSIGYEGLDVQATNLLRRQLADHKVRLLFVKNRMIDRAFKELGRVEISSICDGQTAFADGSEDPVSLARLLVDFQKQHKELKIHGAVVEETVLDSEGVIGLSKSPTKEELKGQIVGQALSPGGKLAGAFMGPAQMLASQIKKHAENLEESGEAA